MDSKGRIKGIYNNSILIELDSDTAIKEAMSLTENDLSISLKKYREKRSLNANAYLWVLCTKIAEKLRTSKDEVYEDMLQSYGYAYEDEQGHVVIAVKPEVDMRKCGHWKFYQDSEDGNSKYYYLLKGTSEYDTKEMAYLLDMIVQEAKELNIETETPENIERMKQSWGVEV